MTIPFGKELLPISVPHVGQILSPPTLTPIEDVGDLLKAELGGEYCASLLETVEKKVRGGNNPTAAIVVNDYTRPTPLHAVLPTLLDVLNACGVEDSLIRIVIALGTHRPMSEEEFRSQAGEQVLNRVGFVNPDIDDPHSLLSLGTSPSGVEVLVNREYAQADVKIAVGTILPHGAVGFSGGAKLIYPGIAGRKTVESFHVAANSDPGNQAGRLDSPIREEIEKLVELVGLDLMINLVVDPAGAVCGLSAGHYIDSHRRAVPLAQKLYGLPISRKSAVLVVGSTPADLDFWQAAKAIFNCQAAVEDGGWLVLLAPCAEGIPAEHASFDRCIGLPPVRIAALLAQTAGQVEPAALAGRDGADPSMDRVTLAPALALSRFRQRIRIAVVSPGLSSEQVERMGFSYFRSVEAALDSILKDLPAAERRVDVVTHGGATYPFVGPGAS
ncbi:MAG: nickel-dependent lactate racemase [Spirochaetaceae bacterium]|nr:MAG: nickel-dependent lactate racemase [Spirochaetaceae bacterium]